MSKTTIIVLVITLILLVGVIIYFSKNNKLVEGGGTGLRFVVMGEKGPEYVIPNWMLERNDVRELVEQLEIIRLSKK